MAPRHGSAEKLNKLQLQAVNQWGVSCVHSQELFAEPAAPTIALGIYYLCLPLLLILGILVLSFAAVYLLVPIARQCGVHFNEVGSVSGL